MGRGPGVHFDAIGEAWDLVRKDLGHWIAATLVLVVVGFALQKPVDLFMDGRIPERPRFDQFGEYLTGSALEYLLSSIPDSVTSVLIVGMVLMGVRKARGEYIDVGMMFEPFRRFGTLFLVNLLYTLISTASALACLLPALYFVPVLVLMPTVAYLKKVGPLDALSLTFDACRSHWLGLLGLSIVLLLILVAGLCACLVGVLFAWPLVCVVLAIHYRAFFEHPSPVAYPERGL